MKRNYIAIIHKEYNSEYGVSFPDFLTCVTSGSTIDEAKDMAQEALQFHIDGLLEDGIELPEPKSLEDAQVKDAIAYFIVPIDTPKKHVVRINATFDPILLKKIDEIADEKGLNRSAWLAQVAEKEINSLHSNNTSGPTTFKHA